MIRVNKAERAGFRVVVTGGFSEDGYSIPEKKNIYMMLHQLPPNDPKQYESGVKLLTSSYQRDIPSAKTTIYIQSMHLQPQIKKAGAFEVLYHWKGEITECSRCNIFFICDRARNSFLINVSTVSLPLPFKHNSSLDDNELIFPFCRSGWR